MRFTIGVFLAICLLVQAVSAAQAEPAAAAVQTPTVKEGNPKGKPEALRAGRGSFRSPRMGYSGGNRTRNPGASNPGNRTPAAPAPRTGGFLGGMFGGFLAGSLLGGLLNPFGFGGTGGVSLFGILFWGVLLYLGYRVLRGVFNRGR